MSVEKIEENLAEYMDEYMRLTFRSLMGMDRGDTPMAKANREQKALLRKVISTVKVAPVFTCDATSPSATAETGVALVKKIARKECDCRMVDTLTGRKVTQKTSGRKRASSSRTR